MSSPPANTGNRYGYVRGDLHGPLQPCVAQPQDPLSGLRVGRCGRGVDADDQEDTVLVVDTEQDAVVAAAGAAQALQLVTQRLAHPVRILCPRAGEELDDHTHDPSG